MTSEILKESIDLVLSINPLLRRSHARNYVALAHTSLLDKRQEIVKLSICAEAIRQATLDIMCHEKLGECSMEEMKASFDFEDKDEEDEKEELEKNEPDFVLERIKSLGNGASCVCFEMKDELDSSNVYAVKIVPWEILSEHPTIICEELRIQLLLSHENILPLYRVMFVPETKHLLLMSPVCHEWSLRKFLDEKYPYGIPIPLARLWMKQLLSALSYLHQRNIAHRDIKLNNVLLQNVDANNTCTQKTTVRLADFGFSQQLAHSNIRLTRVLGTRPFMSPELVELYYVIAKTPKDKRNDPSIRKYSYGLANDVWSLGICFFMMLTGSHPFCRSSIQAEQIVLELKRNFETKQFIYKLPEGTPSGLKEIMNGMLAFEEQKRWSAEKALKHPWFL